jgi:hypothetical protein
VHTSWIGHVLLEQSVSTPALAVVPRLQHVSPSEHSNESSQKSSTSGAVLPPHSSTETTHDASVPITQQSIGALQTAEPQAMPSGPCVPPPEAPDPAPPGPGPLPPCAFPPPVPTAVPEAASEPPAPTGSPTFDSLTAQEEPTTDAAPINHIAP